MRKVVLYIAMSLDGYIADKNGDVDWLGGDVNNFENDDESYTNFIKTVDTVILGYNTYKQIVSELSPNSWVYSGLKSYVMTHKKLNSEDEIIFTDKNIKDLIFELKNDVGKDIWLCGGASVVKEFISLNLIDKYQISIMPILLGDGVRLFEKQNERIKLKLITSKINNGINEIIYNKIN